MADIEDVRTLEDLIVVVRRLYFNLNKIDALYYDMFVNPEPMTLTLERYDETGKLVTVSLKNRAAELTNAVTGYGSPEGVVTANTGVLYVDLSSGVLWYKTQDGTNYGWVATYSNINTPNYLPVDGSGAQLTNLNASAVTSGILGAAYGGTGAAGTLNGLVKANGSGAYTQAVEGKDYISPNTLVGMVSYFPKQLSASRTDWLLCNGGTFSATDYPLLYSFLGNSTTLPNIADKFMRGWDGTSTTGDKAIGSSVEDTLKSHTHTVSGSATTSEAGSHTHTRGSMNITGTLNSVGPGTSAHPTGTGAFILNSTFTGQGSQDAFGNPGNFTFDASQTWSGNTSQDGAHTHTLSGSSLTIANTGATETAPKHVVMVPMIYAGPKAN